MAIVKKTTVVDKPKPKSGGTEKKKVTAPPATMKGNKTEMIKKVDSMSTTKTKPLNADRMSYQSKKVVRMERGNEGKTGKSGIFLYHDQQGKDKTFVSSENETMARNSPQFKAYAAASKNKKK